MKTTFVIRAGSAGGSSLVAKGLARSSCSTISARLRWRRKPSVAVAQNVQPIAQPTWVDTQSVSRSPSGIRTLSIVAPSRKRKSSFCVPSEERLTFASVSDPMVKLAASSSRSPHATFVISWKSRTPR